MKQIDSYNKIILKYSQHFFPIRIGDKSELIRFPLLLRKSEERNLLIQKLQKNGIGASGLYPYPLNVQPGMEKYNLKFCPNAALIAKQVITLPVHEYMTEREYEKIDYLLGKYLVKK